METTRKLFLFTIDEQQYALDFTVVQRVVRAVEITPLPKAPAIVLGVINIRGRVVPVINIRRRFNLPERETEPGDQFIIANTPKRRVALAADAVGGILNRPVEAIISAESIVPGTEYVEGVLKLDDGIVFIHDLCAFLSLEEEKGLTEAMKETQ